MMTETESEILFPLGRITATPGALALMRANYTEYAEVALLQFLNYHQSGDWGAVDADDARLNDLAVRDGARVLSAYTVGDGKVWVITEADRSSTTVLLPEDY